MKIKVDSRWVTNANFLQVELTALETELWGCDDTHGWSFRTHVQGKAHDLIGQHPELESARVFAQGDITNFHAFFRGNR